MSGRIRTLKPEWLEDELLQESSSDARVLSAALILLADDHGNGRGSEKFLAGQVFPGQPIKVTRDAMTRLAEIRYCRFYEVEGQRYFSIRNWAKHQKVDKPGRPKVPEPPANIRDSSRDSLESSSNEGGDFAPRARPLPLPGPYPDPDPGTGQARGSVAPDDEPLPDNDQPRPLPLTWKAHPVAVASLAQWAGVSELVIRIIAEEFVSYWTIGDGRGKAREHWQARFRERVRKLKLQDKLGEFVEKAAKREREEADDHLNEQAQTAHEARIAKLNAEARAKYPDGPPPAPSKLTEGIG